MTQPTRRDFLKILLASSIAESLDVEKLLWTPKPIITIPHLNLSDIIAIERTLPTIKTLFERDDVFYATLKNENKTRILSRNMRIPLSFNGYK